jgi:hypothetical protein
MCTVLLPPGVNKIAVKNKYLNKKLKQIIKYSQTPGLP